jgi:hypothetical protein
MKRILLLTVAILAACLFGGASARHLDGRYADSSPTRLSPPMVTLPRSHALDIAPTLVDH